MRVTAPSSKSPQSARSGTHPRQDDWYDGHHRHGPICRLGCAGEGRGLRSRSEHAGVEVIGQITPVAFANNINLLILAVAAAAVGYPTLFRANANFPVLGDDGQRPSSAHSFMREAAGCGGSGR